MEEGAFVLIFSKNMTRHRLNVMREVDCDVWSKSILGAGRARAKALW